MATALTAPDNANFNQMGATLATVGSPANVIFGMVLTAPDENTVGGAQPRPTSGQLFPLGMFYGGVLTMGQVQMQVFTGPSGTFIVPSGVMQVKARQWGAGAGGGGSASAIVSGGSGGGGGGYTEGIINVSAVASLAIVNGTGGIGGTGAANGTDGTLSSITATGISVVCNGGIHGVFAPSTAVVSGGAGGTASGLALVVQGSQGGEGYTYGPASAAKGFGGGAFASPAGPFGNSPGGGGGGGANGSAGLNGNNGLTIIEYEA